MATRHKHFLGLENVPRAELLSFMKRSAFHKEKWLSNQRQSTLAGKLVANTFFEDSTRTRSSFEIAARNLGADVLNWSSKGSSTSKGETLLDTVRNIAAMKPVAIVIRHSSSGAPALCAKHVECSIINAGDGWHEHPSQGLLDAFTLWERWGDLEERQIAIVGDIRHSRVARSNIFALRTLGARVVLCGPPTLIPSEVKDLGCEVSFNLDEILPSLDAVMLLRLQLERQSESLFPSPKEYAKLFSMNSRRAAKLKEGAVIMHPGPINRGLEIAPEVADGSNSVILEQVENGVAVRMAILEACA